MIKNSVDFDDWGETGCELWSTPCYTILNRPVLADIYSPYLTLTSRNLGQQTLSRRLLSEVRLLAALG